MKKIKKIVLIGIILLVVDVSIIWILNIVDVVDSADFSSLLKDSVSIIGIVVLASIVISILMGKKVNRV